MSKHMHKNHHTAACQYKCEITGRYEISVLLFFFISAILYRHHGNRFVKSLHFSTLIRHILLKTAIR